MNQRIIVMTCALLALWVVPAFGQSKEPVRGIENVAGDVYRFQNNFHSSLVVVTEEGGVIVDPINYDTWRSENIQGMATYLTESGQVQ